jgi:hypothetical protein
LNITSLFELLLQQASSNQNRGQRKIISKDFDWAEVLTQAERHGLGPLLSTHFQASDIQLPISAKRTLQALYLRHRHANRVRAEVLQEVLTAFQAADIQALLLKGAALAQLIYPEPGLRPMNDVDLLVSPAQASQAQTILAELGFQAPLPKKGRPLPGKHLSAATRHHEGFMISLEIHHNLFNDDFPVSMTLEDLTTPPLPLDLNGFVAHTLGYEDMLWHLCRHAVFIFQPLRLIWVVDIVGFAERFATQIDWERIAIQYPFVLTTLTALHHLTPLSETLRQQANLNIDFTPRGVGQEFQGWPRFPLAAQRAKSYRQLFSDTFFPSEWWLGLNYGVTRPSALWWQRWIGHPSAILGWAGQVLLRRLGVSF